MIDVSDQETQGIAGVGKNQPKMPAAGAFANPGTDGGLRQPGIVLQKPEIGRRAQMFGEVVHNNSASDDFWSSNGNM